MFEKLTKAAHEWSEEHRRRVMFRELLKRNDHDLEDIGLKRDDIEATLGITHPLSALEQANNLSPRRC